MSQATPAASTTEHIDPVCGMSVDPAEAAGSSVYQGQTYYFCHPGCLERFEAAPGEFVAGDGALRPAATQTVPGARNYVCPMDPEIRQAEPGSCPKCGMALEPDLSDPAALMKVEYTCPMHPEIVRDQPGACPICGMALEPRVVGFEDEPNPELIDMTRRFWLALVLGAPVFLLTMADMAGAGALMRFIDMRTVNWIGLACSTPVVFWAGWPFFDRAWASVVNRSPNMFTLIGMGVGTAYVYSAIGTIAPGLFPEGFRVARRRRDLLRHGGRHHRAGAAGPGAGAARAGPDVRRLEAAPRPRAADGAASFATDRRRTSRSPTCTLATSCACGPARRFRSTASSSKGTARSTNRWSPANRSRSRRRRAIE